MNDLAQNLIVARGVKPDAHGTGAVAGAAIDTKMCQKGLIFIDLGDKGVAGTVDVTLTHCDTSGGTYTTHTTVAQIAANGQTVVEVSGFKRYVKVNATVGTNAVDLSATFIGGDAHYSKNLPPVA